MAGRALAFTLLVSALAIGEPPPVRRAEAVQVTDWFAPPGAPPAILSLAAGDNDFLWAASEQGLFRFDGLHFHRFDAQPAKHVAVTGDGDVWFAGDQGLRVMRGTTVKLVHSEPVLALAAQGNQVAIRTKSSVWFGGRERLRDLRVAANGPLTADGENRIWFACGAEACAVGADGQVARTPLAGGPWPIAAANGGVWAWKAGTITRNREVMALTPARVGLPDGRMGFLDSRGRTWMGMTEWIEDGAYHEAADPHPGGYYDPVFAEDRHRQMWVGSTQKPLGLILPKPWRPLRLTLGPTETVKRLASGRLLAGGEAGWSESLDEGRQWTRWAPALAGAKAWDAIETEKGTWVIVQDRGVLLLDRQGQEIGAVQRGPFASLQPRRFMRDREDRIWLGAKGGLFRLNEEAMRLEPAKLPPDTLSPLVFATGPDGQEWMASSAGIAKLADGEWKIEVPPSVFLFDARLGALAVGPGPEFWVGYRREGPLSRVRREGGAWKRTDFAAADGYEPNYTRVLLRDQRGWIWRGTPGGLTVSDGQHVAPHEWIRFETPHEGVSDGGLFEDRDGTIWVGSSLGIHHVVPASDWFEPMRHAKPRVTAWVADGVPDFAPRDGQRWGAGVGRLRIDYAQWPATRPRRPAVEFRLAPLEKEWRYSAEGSVTYDNLPAGFYRFELRADRGGAVEAIAFETGAASRPPWLWALAGAGSVALLWFLWWRWTRPVTVVEYWQAKQAFLESKARENAAEPERPRLIAGHYRLGDSLGSGGFSEVYRAVDERTGATVALKLLPVGQEMPEWQRSRFDRETAALARLSHPGVVRLLDAGAASDGALYLVMPVIEGISLRQVLAAGPAPRARRAEWVRQIGSALQAAHDQGILHRDLKPENILIESASDRAIVVDFGAAAVRDSAAGGRSTLMLGSLDYLAPEQVQGRSSPQTDIYAFAVMVFELCTGVRYRSLADGSEAGLRRAFPGFAPELVKELARGLTFDPAHRPASIGAYAETLAGLL